MCFVINILSQYCKTNTACRNLYVCLSPTYSVSIVRQTRRVETCMCFVTNILCQKSCPVSQFRPAAGAFKLPSLNLPRHGSDAFKGVSYPLSIAKPTRCEGMREIEPESPDPLYSLQTVSHCDAYMLRYLLLPKCWQNLLVAEAFRLETEACHIRDLPRPTFLT